MWAGADVSPDVWLVYSGATVAPFGELFADGLRLRVVGGYGHYSYESEVASTSASATPTYQRHDAETHFVDVMVGYLKRLDPLTAKAFVGISSIDHEIAPVDDFTIVAGTEIGIKGVVELWLNVGEKGWGSLDLSWTTAHDTRAARARAGYRLWPKLSIGAESGINVDGQGECRIRADGEDGCKVAHLAKRYEVGLLDYARAGLFLRYEWEGGEASLSAGALGTTFDLDDDVEVNPYVTVNWITQF